MIKVDWIEAPEWAGGHGLISWQGFTEVWFNADQYAVVGREGGTYPWGGGTSDTRHNHTRCQVEYITTRPDRWNGKGLPPAGIDVEFSVVGCSRWIEGEVLYSSLYTVVISGNGFEHVYNPKALKFRPIRTTEQIEAEERAKAIDKIRRDTDYILDEICAAAVLAAGYRKQEAK